MAKGFSGYTEKTAKNLLLDSGAFFLNYDIATDTFKKAKDAGKLLGATRGGGTFSAVPEIRHIEIDGVRGAAKGLTVIDSWEVRMGATVVEVNKSVIEASLGASNNTYDVDTMSDKITGKGELELSDYIENITFVGKRAGSDQPLIIQVYNAINTTGLSLTTSDKGESTISLDFLGHYSDEDLDTPPFAIYVPEDFL